MELSSVAAVAENLVIGDDGEIPWPSLPTDRRLYRARVSDDPVILGRRTFESMRADLPGRVQIVMSRTERTFAEDSAYWARSVDDAVALAEATDADRAFVLGGGAVYELFQPHLDRMFLTRVPGRYRGDTTYPPWEEREWRLVTETEYDRFRIEEWERCSGST